MKKIYSNEYLNIISSSQFKTIKINFNFLEKINRYNLSERSLLSLILPLKSKDYKNKIEIYKKLEKLYGSKLYIYTDKIGCYSVFTIQLSILNPSLVSDNLIQDSLHFVYQILERPFLINGLFDLNIFNKEREKLLLYLESLKDDGELYTNELANFIFNNENYMDICSLGNSTIIKKLKNKNIFDAYNRLLKNNRLDIVVSGNINEQNKNKIVNTLSKFNFSLLKKNFPSPFNFNHLNKPIQRKIYVESLEQSRLTIIYKIFCYFYDKDYFKWIVFNSLFGKSSISVLFLSIREREQLSYDIYSEIDPFNGTLSIHAGIDAVDYEKCISSIKQQIFLLSKGNFDKHILFQSKIELINDVIVNLDSQDYILMHNFYLDIINKKEFSIYKIINRIKNVSVDDICKCAKILKEQVYLLTMNGESYEI